MSSKIHAKVLALEFEPDKNAYRFIFVMMGAIVASMMAVHVIAGRGF